MLRLTARLLILWSLLSPSGLAWGAVAQGAALQESGHNIVCQKQAGQGSYEEKLALVNIQAGGDVTLDGEAYLEQVNHLKVQVINRAKLVGATVALVSRADVTVAAHAAESAARNNALVTITVVGAILVGLEVVDKAMMAHDAHQLVEALNAGNEAKAEELATGLLIAAGLDLAQIPGSSILAKVFNKFPVVQKIVPDGLLAKVGVSKGGIDAAKRLGINLDDIPINNGVARTKINLSSTLDPKDISQLKDVLRSRGANKAEIDTGFIANEKLDALLRRRAQDGKPFNGGTVRFSNSKSSDFTIDFDLR